MESVYVLNANPAEIERLDWNHHNVLVPLTGRLLPDHILAYLQALGRPPVVADIGTGTGVWLKSLAAELPEGSHLDGFDIVTTKFHPPSELPAGVHLQVGNAFEPFPEQLHEKYDLVHVRLLVSALRAEQWIPLANNLKTLLRPGGYLFWEEVSYATVITMPLTQSFFDWMSILTRFGISKGRDLTAPARLLEDLRRNSFEEAGEIIHNTWGRDNAHRQKTLQGMYTLAVGELTGIVRTGGFEELQTQEDVSRITQAFKEDIDRGEIVGGLDFWWIWGRKAGL